MDTTGLGKRRDSSGGEACKDSKLLALLGFLSSPTHSHGSAEGEGGKRGAENPEPLEPWTGARGPRVGSCLFPWYRKYTTLYQPCTLLAGRGEVGGCGRNCLQALRRPPGANTTVVWVFV